jgi:hypothetical protein
MGDDLVSELPTLSRPRFFDGQLLTAADLESVQSYHRDLLWLHQRTLHSWGIASGLHVAGKKGDRYVTVAPGYAIDSDGQSIVLTADAEMQVPAVVAGPSGGPVTYYLTIAYASDDQLQATVRDGVCATSGSVRLEEAVDLAWHEPADAAKALVLCSITVLNCKLADAVDLSLRPSALPDRQPFVYAGQSQPAATKWSLWRPGDSANAAPIGLRASINTAEAGFANTPRYHACIVGSREFSKPGGNDVAIVDGYVQISGASAAGFDLQMTLVPGNAAVNPDWALVADKMASLPVMNRWYVSWVGVEG